MEEYEYMRNKKMTKKQKVTAALSAVLVLALGVGGTLAYLTARSGEKRNEFTFVTAGDEDDDKDMKVTIYEPDFDGEAYPEYEEAIPDDEDLGENLAKDIVPGRVIPKNPFLRNTSAKEVDEWVLMTYEYWAIGNGIEGDPDGPRLLSNAEVEALFEDGYITIEINATNWEKITDADQGAHAGSYLYRQILEAQEDTKPLFTEVKIDLEAPNSFMDSIMAYGGFEIRLSGYAMQAENVSYTAAKAQFVKLGDGTDDIFNNTNR